MRIGCAKFDIVGVKKALIINNEYKNVVCWREDGSRKESWGFDGVRSEGMEVIEEIILENGNKVLRVVA